MYLKVPFKLNTNIPKRILKMKEHLFKNSVLYIKSWYLNKDSSLHILVQKQSDKPSHRGHLSCFQSNIIDIF